MVEYQKGEMKPEDCQTKGCVFCNTTDPNLHINFCGICKKCICDRCRPRYGMRAAAAVDEHFSKVTLSAESLKERMKQWTRR